MGFFIFYSEWLVLFISGRPFGPQFAGQMVVYCVGVDYRVAFLRELFIY